MLAMDLVSKKFVKANIDDTLSKLIGKFKKYKASHAVIFDKDKYLGVISKKFFLTSRINPDEMKISNIIKKRSKSKVNIYVPELKPSTTLKEIARLMFTADVKILPVLDKKKFIGVVHALDVLKNISTSYKGVPVKTIYSTPVIVNYDEPIGLVIKLFNRMKFHRLPVVDKNENFIGMITLGDLVKKYHVWGYRGFMLPAGAQHTGFKLLGTGEKTSQINASISTIFSPAPLYNLAPKSSIAQAINLMVKADISSVVITDKRKVVGILTVRDVLKDYAAA